MRLLDASQRRLAATPPSHRRTGTRGQGLVEFALVLMPLFMILLGIIQFGFVFNSYITISNAAREGARVGTIQIYAPSLSKEQNDLARNNAIKSSVIASMNLLGKTSPHFSTSSTWNQSGLTFTNGDLIITYLIPDSVNDSDARVGQQVTVRAIYHQDVVVPIVGALLPKDSGGRIGLTSEVTMVVN